MDKGTKPAFFCDNDYNAWLLFNHAWRAMFKAREKELQEYKITPEQAEVLMAVQALGNNATPAEISRSTLREPHTISGIINRMAEKGLLTKNRDLKRRNLIRVALTEKGRLAFEHSTNRKAIFDVMGELKPGERQVLCGLLERLQGRALHLLGIEERPAFPPRAD